MSVTLFDGGEILEVVGESHYQEEIRSVVQQIGREVAAILVPEPDNSYDSNAVSVWIAGFKVGHLSRSDAEVYQTPIIRLMKEEDQPLALTGRIFGGEPEKPSLGVFLYHNPEDFGLRNSSATRGESAPRAGVNTGASEASNMSWYANLPDDPVRAIKELRELLAAEAEPLERHFIFNELERSLYKCRDVFPSALNDFDDVCEQHHSEMGSIRAAFLGQFGDIPVLPTYRQAAIRWQKQHDFESALMWANRGVEVYGNDANRPEGVDDLRKRATRYVEKLAEADSPDR